ncbi:MAG: putative toxin-antitoxin system toxin component, PIN family [Pseudomonadota bacterium]|nr:putative toxin-antitoxin system toxin component, PIN family [Pseudomonadota bacterium]
MPIAEAQGMALVLDTSTLIGALLKPQSLPAQALHWAWQVGQPIASRDTLHELDQVLARPFLDRYRTLQERQTFAALYRAMCREVTVSRPVQQCRDPRDDKFLALAAAGAARVLITSDQDLLVLHRFENTLILTPRAFVDLCTTHDS